MEFEHKTSCTYGYFFVGTSLLMRYPPNNVFAITWWQEEAEYDLQSSKNY